MAGAPMTARLTSWLLAVAALVAGRGWLLESLGPAAAAVLYMAVGVAGLRLAAVAMAAEG
ncbi:hypothetical protein EMO91_07030 [Bifidobacterium myosotis]|uniref:Uncharacterized protein n=2 Tax=Bifidobacterium myosotis TaxID=1630166 RepID=A0A5M9ZKM9_9BIFI|nr:hypothetical protein EMO91_07030 [Bifidobacterium myosotis]